MNGEFQSILQAHAIRYSHMQPQDFGKLAYQSEFGPRHLLLDKEQAYASIQAEEEAIADGGVSLPPEPIGNSLCRFHLRGTDSDDGAELLARLFCRTAEEHTGSQDGLLKRLEQLWTLDVPGIAKWLVEYMSQGCPPVRHSKVYRNSYRPHYRVVKGEYAHYFPALFAVSRLVRVNRPVVVAIDGRCGSGKTGLAVLLQKLFPCNVFHMDDFYLPPDKRASDWMDLPGGNIDFARLRKEAIAPAQSGIAVIYRPFDCQSGHLLEPVQLPACQLNLLEGSYSHHPNLFAQYDLKIFLTCSGEAQTRRLRKREGEYFPVFQAQWIPLEERYFQSFGIEADSALVFNTSDFFT